MVLADTLTQNHFRTTAGLTENNSVAQSGELTNIFERIPRRVPVFGHLIYFEMMEQQH